MGAAEDGAQGPAQAVGCEHANQAHCQPKRFSLAEVFEFFTLNDT